MILRNLAIGKGTHGTKKIWGMSNEDFLFQCSCKGMVIISLPGPRRAAGGIFIEP